MTDPDRSPKSNSRLEDEVREILVRADQPASFTEHLQRKAQRRRRGQWNATVASASARWARLGAGGSLVGAIVVAFIASWVRSSSPLLATLLALFSVALIVSLYVQRYRGPGQRQTKQWRGRDLDVSPPPAWVGSLRDRFRGTSRR